MSSRPISALRGTDEQGCFSAKRRVDDAPDPAELARAIAGAKRGDKGAIRYLYLRYAGNVFGYARSILRDEHEAEDVVQQVFTRLLTAIGGYEQRAVPFSAWLLRITHNMAIDHTRRRARFCAQSSDTAPESSEAQIGSDAELSLAVREALDSVPAAQREVIVLRHVGGYSPVEIAAQLGRSEDSIHGLHHRGRRTLKAALRQAGAVPVTAPGRR